MLSKIKITPEHFFRFILLMVVVFIVYSLLSCKVREKIVTQYEYVDTILYIEKTTTKFDTIQLPADSAYIEAYFKCDSAGNALIKELNETKGKFKVKTVYKDNVIKILVSVDSSEIIRQAEKQWLETYTSNQIESNETINKRKSFNWYYYFLSGVVVGITLWELIKRRIKFLIKKFTI